MNRFTFHVFKSKKNKLWYFHLKSRNGKKVCQSEGYTRKESVLSTISSMKDRVQKARIVFD